MNTDVEQYLMEQLEKRKNRDYAREDAGARELAAQNNMNNLYAVLADSAARAGSLGGKTADASAVRKFADSSAASNNALSQQMRQDQADQDQEMTRQETLAQYLLNKKGEAEKLAQQERIAGNKLSFEREKEQGRQDKDDTFRGRELTLKEQKLALERQEAKQKAEENKEKLAKEKQPAATQFAASQYGRRIEAANAALDELEGEGFDRTSVKQGILAALPVNQLKGEQLQRQEQAERNFVNAILRRESGAAISPTEFSSAEKQYFPRAGDTPEVLAQKKQNREQALAGLRAEAGTAWEKVPAIAKVAPKKTGESGTAYAGPAAKNLNEMSDEELDAELARLKGGK